MATKVSTRASHILFADLLRNREPFTTHGALMGDPHVSARTGMFGASGQLDGADLVQWRNDMREHIDYVVWSYNTPIAWHVNIQGQTFWRVPDAKYSVTTSKHQGRISAAISSLTD